MSTNWILPISLILSTKPNLNFFLKQEKKKRRIKAMCKQGLYGKFISFFFNVSIFLTLRHLLPCFKEMNLSAAVLVVTIISWAANSVLSIRIPDRISVPLDVAPGPTLKIAVFALGSFWRSEAVFGCLNGVVRTAAGYTGGSRPNPEYRSLGDHAECVQVVILFFHFCFTLFRVSF